MVSVHFLFIVYLLSCTMASGGEKGNKEEINISEYIEKVNEHPDYKVLTVEEYNKLLRVASTPRTVDPPTSKPMFSTPKGNLGPRMQGLLNTVSSMKPKTEPLTSILESPRHNLNASSCITQINPPKLPLFSGTDEPQKGEVPYEVWSFELKCLIKSGQYTEHLLLQAVRNSLKGLARSMLVPLGEDVSLTDVINKLDGFFGSVSTNENLMQAFYSDFQKDSESIVVYASRLEETISKAIQFGFIDQIAKDAMLRNKFWTGLSSQTLKNSTRHLYDSIKDFQLLLKEIRKVQQENINLQKSKTRTATANAEKAEVKNEDLKKEFGALISKIDRLEHTINSHHSDYQDLSRRINSLELQEKANNFSSSEERGLNRPFRGRNRGFRRIQSRGFYDRGQGQNNFNGFQKSENVNQTQRSKSSRNSFQEQPKE